MRLAGVYLATVMSRERQVKEGLGRLLPLRKARGERGKKPTALTYELSGPIPVTLTKEEVESGEEIETI